jgi:chemotaxis protein MotA
MTALFDPLSLLLVLAGALGLAAVQHGLAAARAALAFRQPADDPAAEAAAAERLIHAATAAVSHRGLFAAETLAPRHHYLRATLYELADARDLTAFAATLLHLRERAGAQDRAPVRFWNAVAEAAPALGMIGTVAGMIGMAAELGDSAQTGPSLALALTSTLYGLVLSACIAAPLAERAQRRAEAGERWRLRLAEAFLALVARETAGRA